MGGFNLPARLKYLLSTVLLVLFFVGGYLAYERWGSVEPLPEGLIQVNGRIEGDHVTVASKYPGHIHEILPREGDTVEQGQILVRLEDAETRARVAQAQHGVAARRSQKGSSARREGSGTAGRTGPRQPGRSRSSGIAGAQGCRALPNPRRERHGIATR